MTRTWSILLSNLRRYYISAWECWSIDKARRRNSKKAAAKPEIAYVYLNLVDISSRLQSEIYLRFAGRFIGLHASGLVVGLSMPTRSIEPHDPQNMGVAVEI